MLGASGNTITNNVVDGVGAVSIGANLYGINLVRKGSGSSTVNSDRNTVTCNTVRQSGSYGIRILGGSDNTISAAWWSTRVQCSRRDNIPSAPTNNIISIISTDSLTNNRIIDNILDAGASASRI